jgi:hypothetical protein
MRGKKKGYHISCRESYLCADRGRAAAVVITLLPVVDRSPATGAGFGNLVARGFMEEILLLMTLNRNFSGGGSRGVDGSIGGLRYGLGGSGFLPIVVCFSLSITLCTTRKSMRAGQLLYLVNLCISVI